eukprot:230204-Pelagomonas_calceolata.AAC.1
MQATCTRARHTICIRSCDARNACLEGAVSHLQVHATHAAAPNHSQYGNLHSRQDVRPQPHHPRQQATAFAPPQAHVYNTYLLLQSPARAIYPLPRAGHAGPGYAGPAINCPACPECGRSHPSYAVCYGRNYERPPHAAGQTNRQMAPQAHVTTTHVPEFATNADLHWPPPMSMMTAGIGSAHVSAAGEEALVSAAAPVPFEASSS